MKKINGYKIIKFNNDFNKNDIVIKRKTVSFYEENGKYICFSYNDLGFKVKTFGENLDDCIQEVIRKSKTKPKLEGWIIKKRNLNDSHVEGKNIIFWWEKGLTNLTCQKHYKCDFLHPEGGVVEEVGDTLEEAISNATFHLGIEFKL